MDSGASHHITSDLANLSTLSLYNGAEEVIVADGKGQQITHTGLENLHSPTRSLFLHDVLRVPSAATNIVSVNMLCTDNDVFVEFFPHNF